LLRTRPTSSVPLRLLLVFALVAALLAACGGDDDSSASGSASGSGSGSASGPSEETDAGAFPVTIEHALGETTIDAPPERVVTWGWGSADAAIALGVVPVAIPFQEYGGDADGVLPWLREKLEADGAEVPEVLPNSEEPPFEVITAQRPDLILAPYSGIDEAQYELLAQIAPTVAYPDEAWATPWRDVIEIVGRALGRSEEAAALLADIDDQVAEAAAAHPEFESKTVAQVWDAAGTFYVYKPADARVEFTTDLGFESAPSVAELANGGETFYYTLSYEQVDALESDILISYADSQQASETFLASDHAQLMEQVQAGRVAEIVGAEFIASVSPPTALSLTWGLDEYVRILSAAAKKG
jgi:iron complex transport system substrate-binding protein